VFDKRAQSRPSQTKNLNIKAAIEVSALNAIGEVKDTDVETLDRDIERLNRSLELTDKLSEIDVAEFLMDDFTAVAELKKKKSATQKLDLKGLLGKNDDQKGKYDLNRIDEENSPVSSQAHKQRPSRIGKGSKLEKKKSSNSRTKNDEDKRKSGNKRTDAALGEDLDGRINYGLDARSDLF